MGLTKAERHNRMMDRVFNQYDAHLKAIPTGSLLDSYLELAKEKLGLPSNEALSRFRHYTVYDWEQTLKTT